MRRRYVPHVGNQPPTSRKKRSSEPVRLLKQDVSGGHTVTKPAWETPWDTGREPRNQPFFGQIASLARILSLTPYDAFRSPFGNSLQNWHNRRENHRGGDAG